MHLVDMGKYKKENGGFYWILNAMILSRYGFAIPVYRKDTSNMTKAISTSEFYNVYIKTLLEKHDIKYFSTNSDKKAAVVERFNRTLKTVMRKYFYAVLVISKDKSKGRHVYLSNQTLRE